VCDPLLCELLLCEPLLLGVMLLCEPLLPCDPLLLCEPPNDAGAVNARVADNAMQRKGRARRPSFVLLVRLSIRTTVMKHQ
jgi:hypothetical protein